MKKVICKVPVIYNGEWHSTGEEIEIAEEHEEELQALCIPVCEAEPEEELPALCIPVCEAEHETPAEPQEPAKSRRRK